MDNPKICDTGLYHLGHTVFNVLDKKLEQKTEKSNQSSSIIQSPKGDYPLLQNPKTQRKILPLFTFQFVKYKIRDSVEYDVKMLESYVVLGRSIKNSYSFKTRYSMLEKLHENIGGSNFPPKKIFGNKNESFILQRMKLLEKYLNNCSKRPNKQFLKFIKQIKDRNFDLDMSKDFKL